MGSSKRRLPGCASQALDASTLSCGAPSIRHRADAAASGVSPRTLHLAPTRLLEFRICNYRSIKDEQSRRRVTGR